jgi:hypothetical protein
VISTNDNRQPIQHLTFDDLSSEAAAYDDAVLRTAEIDHFCSSSFWILPAARSLMAPGAPWVHRADGAYVAMARSHHGRSASVLHPLEAMWALPSPLIGAGAEALTELFVESLGADSHWSAAVITGLGESSALWRKLVPALSKRYLLSRGPITRRYAVDLTSGVDGFLRHRSAGFRKNLRKAERRARQLDLRFEIADECALGDADASFDRILAIERRSWKGRHGVGIDTEPMSSFYRDMNRRLVERRARRLVFATVDGHDAAYIFGGVLGKTYRGLQFSFDERYAPHSLGNLCQLEEIRRLSDAGMELYDLGSEVPYKKRWGERVFATSCVVVQPSR